MIKKAEERLAIQGGMPVRKNFLPIGRPLLGDEEKQEVMDTLNSDWLSKGPKTQRFENDFKKYVGSKYAVAVSSCTAALHIALLAAGVKPKDEVITTPMTFVATVNAILYVGATPVLADIDRTTFNIDPERIEKKITARTKAIIPVHFAGLPCEMDKIMKIAHTHGLAVIEDAAHALGARYKGKKIGAIGTITAFSFYATKNITTGDGGMATTNNAKLAAKMDVLSFHGMGSDAWKRYGPAGEAKNEMVELGYKYNLTDIQAAIGIHQLKKLDRFIKIKQRYAQEFDAHFCVMPELKPQQGGKKLLHARHLYPVVLNTDRLKINREGFIKAMRRENIGCSIHYLAVHKQPYYRKQFAFKDENLPNASFVSDRIVSLPLYPRMTKKDVHDVIHAVKKVVAYFSK